VVPNLFQFEPEVEFPHMPSKVVSNSWGSVQTRCDSDMLARVVGKHMGDNLNTTVIVENKPGANGMLGSSMVAKSPADGYTLGIATPGNHAANASLYKEVP